MNFLENNKIPNGAKVLLSYMLSKSSRGIWRGTQKYLAEKLHTHRCNVSKYIKLLAEYGYVSECEREGTKAYLINPELGE